MVSCDPAPPPQCSWFSSKEREKERERHTQKRREGGIKHKAQASNSRQEPVDVLSVCLGRLQENRHRTERRDCRDDGADFNPHNDCQKPATALTADNGKQRTVVVVSLSCQAASEPWHPAGRAGH